MSSEECVELKNIMYKTMLLQGAPLVETKSSSDLSNIEKYLEEEKLSNSAEPWSKLDKTAKTRKLLDFANQYKTEKNLTEEESQELVAFFKDCLDRKKLCRVKDVQYDKTKGEIKEVPALLYNKATKHFTLKNLDKRVSTLKSLPLSKTMSNTTQSKTMSNVSNKTSGEKKKGKKSVKDSGKESEELA
jgi:hypothetical protein